MEADIRNNPKSFIEGRARKDLHTLVSVGVRVSGSIATDVVTVQHFEEILEDIKQNSNPGYSVEYQVQRPTGTFWLDDDEGYSVSYSKIANVIAKLEPSDPNLGTNNGIVLNCHFDTKTGSPGATDNLISCSVMLEILRVLSAQPNPTIRNPIIFLFNGAEEYGFHGAHGFVSGRMEPDTDLVGHPWSQNLSVFINLEGAGGGGREILFQATGGQREQTGWLLKAYTESPYPYGNVVAEEAFQFGLIPSDTDFRVFRDFKKIPGLDIAFVKNGYVYHTKFDKITEIPPGSLQHMGTNALAIVEYMGNIDFSSGDDSAGKMVFFDVLGAFMITYSRTVGIILNVGMSVGSIGVIIYFGGWKPKSFLTYAIYLGSTLLAWGASCGVAALAAGFLNAAGYPKPFYSYPSLALLLFGLPAMIAQTIVYSVCLKSSPKDTWLAGKLSVAILLFVTTFITRASYLFVIPLIFGMPAWFGARYAMKGWPRGILVTYIILGELVPLIMSSYILITIIDVFVPNLGRGGSEMNGNLYFGLIISASISILVVPGIVSFFVNYDKRILTTCLVMSVLILNPTIVFGFLGKVPYHEKTPIRLTICDVDRTYYHANGTERKWETGYWFWPWDSDTDNMFPEFSKTISGLENMRDEILDYENCEEIYCSQPFIWPTTKRIKKVHWVPKSSLVPSHLKDSVYMNIIQDTTESPTYRRLTLEFFGPAHLNMVLSPNRNWSANITIQQLMQNALIEREGSYAWKGRKVYWLFHGRGYQEETLIINVDLQKVDPNIDIEESLLEIQLAGLFLDMTTATASNDFINFLTDFPSWTYTGMSWSTVMKMYRID